MYTVRRTNKDQEIETVLAKERKNKAQKERLVRKRKKLKLERQQFIERDR